MTVPEHKSAHSAAGPMAGYLFQPERALYHLALSPRGAMVGIETLDDVAVLLSDGRQLREQDKHYTSEKTPLADRSKELWNSLHIWLKAVDDEEVDLKTTEFHLVTNRILTNGIAFELMRMDDEGARSSFVAQLRATGKNPTETLKSIVQTVLGHSDNQLAAFLARVRVIDATSASYGDTLRKQVADHLHLPDADASEILQGLLGWIHETALDLIRQGKPAWLSRDAFSEQYRRLLFRYQDQLFIHETEDALIPVKDEDRNALRGKLFVKQLLWVGVLGDGEQMLDAIDDCIKSGTEATRLTQVGVIQPLDFRAFEDRLVRRWKTIKRVHVPDPLPKSEDALKTAGRAVLNASMDHREMLAGQQTSEYYLTQGAYHRLADELRVGWHPKYEDKAKGEEGKGRNHEVGNRV